MSMKKSLCLLPQKIILFLVLVLCVVFSTMIVTFAASVAETESNDSFADADVLNSGDIVSAAIGTNGDCDYYKFTLESSSRISFTLTAFMENNSLNVYDSSGMQLWYDDDNVWNSDLKKRTDSYSLDLEAGEYYLRITGYRYGTSYPSVGAYTLDFAFKSAAATNTEPDNSLATATPLTLSGVKTGQIAINDRYDNYAFTLPSSGRIAITVNSWMKYYSLYLMNEDGDELWYTDSNEWIASTGTRSDTHTLDLEKGTYYLCVTGYCYGWSYESTGTYNINVVFTASHAINTEPNNSVAQACPIELSASVRGQIAHNDRTDTYRFALPEDGRLTINFKSFMRYYSLYLLDANANQVWYDDSNEWNATVGKRTDTYSLDLAGGVYYLHVTGYLYNESYASTGTYEFTVDADSAGVNHSEPNNSLADASPIGSAQVNGQISISDTWDIFSFNADSQGSINLTINSFLPSYCVYLMDANGVQLQYKEGMEWNSDNKSRSDTIQLNIPAAGRYYLRFTGYSYGTSYLTTGNYNFTLSGSNLVARTDIQTSSVKINKTQAVLYEQQALVLQAAALPYNSGGTITWSSSDSSVADVDIMGVVTANAQGTAVITAACGDKKANCTITVLSELDTSAKISEVEDNNEMLKAQPIAANGICNGTIWMEGDVDFYKITLPEAGCLTIKMQAKQQYNSIYIYDSNAKELFYDDSNEWNIRYGLRTEYYTLQLLPGDYYIKITGYCYNTSYASTGSYTFLTYFTVAGENTDEPNNQINEAQPIGFSETVMGQIAINDYYDTFMLELPSSGRLTFEMNAVMWYNSLVLFDATGTQLWYDDSNEISGWYGIRNEQYAIDLEAGTYYLQINGYRYGTSYFSAGNYSFIVDFTPANATHTEPNDSLIAACGITMGTTNGQIAINDRVDVFMFEMLEAGDVTLQFTSQMWYYSVYIFDQDGNQKWYDDQNEVHSLNGCLYGEYTVNLPVAGTYYLEVTGYCYGESYASTGMYKFTLDNGVLVPVTGVQLSATDKTLQAGDVFQLNATVVPDNATDKTLVWNTADNSIATVSSDGLVTAISAGTTVISVATTDGTVQNTCNITVGGGAPDIDDDCTHKWNTGTITVAPTCIKKGVKTFSCTICNEKKTEEIPIDSANHSFGAWLADSSATGVERRTCTRCGTVETRTAGTKTAAAVFGSKNGKAGDTVELLLTLKDCAAIKSIQLSDFTYDKTKLEIVSGTWLLTSTTQVKNWSKTSNDATCSFSANADCNKAVFKLTVRVLDKTAPGAYTVTCKGQVSAAVTGSADAKTTLAVTAGTITVTAAAAHSHTFGDAVFDKNTKAYAGTCTECGFVRYERLRGDIDGDGGITAADARLALRASVGLENLNAIEAVAANTDGDESITAADARLILRASVQLEDSSAWKSIPVNADGSLIK